MVLRRSAFPARSGARPDGFTLEPLRFDYDAAASGELPPRQLFLPPNLYFVGTINSDESTQTLSPKVLDRAWVLEAPSADFSNYPPQQEEQEISNTHQHELLALFTRQGQFAVPYKALVAEQLELHPNRRDDLTRLNQSLEEFGVGFGFRVFDEILSFCAIGRENGFYEDEREAFDASIAAKIASRLRGGRGQVEGALQVLLGWSQSLNLQQPLARCGNCKLGSNVRGFAVKLCSERHNEWFPLHLWGGLERGQAHAQSSGYKRLQACRSTPTTSP